VVRLYQIISPARVLDLLETRVLRSWDVGWQTFDITKAGKTWTESPSSNYGLELSVENWFNQEVSPFEAGFIGFHGSKEFHPFVLFFFSKLTKATIPKDLSRLFSVKSTNEFLDRLT